jgi:transposase
VAHIICGVDVSAATLDARIGLDGVWQQFARTTDGVAQLALFCKSHQVSLVVMEATGGYERLPFALLWGADVPVALVNPRSVRRFAEAMGALEKTDKIDTGMIAWYAGTKRIAPTLPASDKQQHFMALVLRIRQLTDLRTAQNNQRRLVDDPDALASFSAIVATINRQIRTLEAKVIALIDADPLWLALDTAFRQIKGVADRTVARLLANLPEIGTLSGKAVAKLTGLAPSAH